MMRMRLARIAAVAAAGLAPIPPPKADRGANVTLQGLAGTWKVLKDEVSRAKAPGLFGTYHRVVIQGNTGAQVRSKSGSPSPGPSYSFPLDTSKSPPHIDTALTSSKGANAGARHGVLLRKGDRLRVDYGKTSKDVPSPMGPNEPLTHLQDRWILQREKPQAPPRRTSPRRGARPGLRVTFSSDPSARAQRGVIAMNRWRWPLLMALALPLAAAGLPPVPKAKDKQDAAADIAKAIQGTWEVTGLERAGAKGVNPPIGQMLIVIEGKSLSRTLRLKDKELKAAGSTFLLDTGKSPAWFDVTAGAGQVQRPAMKGLVRVEGDRLIWVYAMTGDRPTKIDGELGERQIRYTLKRVKK